jgi:hypothetical protein
MRQVGYKRTKFENTIMVWPEPIEEPAIVRNDEIYDAPWPLVKLEDRPEYGGWLCARRDVRWWRITSARIVIKSWLTMVKYRIIVTLSIWNLADNNPSGAPSWRNVGKRRK